MSKVNKDVSIVSINRATNSFFKLQGNRFFALDLNRVNNAKEFYISYITNKDVITSTIEIPKTTPNDEVESTIVSKTYQDLGLDTSLDYRIVYTQSPNESSDSLYFNVFVTNNEVVGNDFAPIAERTGYIDYIAYSPFLMRSLYQKGVIADNSIDCFIYLQKNDAFLAIYQNGEYFQSRPLRYNLKYLCDKFSELSGNRINEEDFNELLKKNGVNFENVIERDYIIQIFEDMFLYINDIIASISKLYKINIQNVYFNSDIGHIKGVEIFIEDRLNLTHKTFDLNIAINAKEFNNLTHIDMLMMLTAQVYLVENDDEFNYSMFLRPPPLYQRDSGKLLIAVLIGLIIGLSGPIFWYGMGYYNEIVANKTQVELDAALAEKSRIENTLKDINNQIKSIEEDTQKQKALLDDKESKLNQMLDKKIAYPMKGVAIYDMSNLVVAQEGNINAISSEDRNMTFLVRTKTDKKMTELLKNISINSKYSVITDYIGKDKNDTNQTQTPEFYDSNISLEVIR